MDGETLYREISQILRTTSKIDSSILRHDDTPLTCYGIDSLSLMRVVSAIERKYDIHIREEEIFNASSLSRLVQVVLKKTARTPPPSFVEALLTHARTRPNQPALIHWTRSGARELSYSGLLSFAATLQGTLRQAQLQPGDLVCILHHDEFEVARLFVGALLSGVVPSVIAPPSPKVDPDRHRKMIRAMIERISPRCLIVADHLLEEARTISGPHVRVIASSELQTPRAVEVLNPVSHEASAVAFYQFSSGTTGLQKGMAITHGKLVLQIRKLAGSTGLDPKDTMVSWLPLYHDMGLVLGLLTPLYQGARAVQLSTFEWLAQPEILLNAVTRHKGTVVLLPNFALMLMADRAIAATDQRWDLSSVRALYNSGEVVTPTAHRRFIERYAPHGLRPIALQTAYGMAENVLAATATDWRIGPPRVLNVSRSALRSGRLELDPSPQDSQEIMSSGWPLEGSTIEIVDDDRRPVPEGVVGEIVVGGDTVFDGYFKNHEATERALIRGSFHSGDLGFVLDRELYVIGRKGDFIISAGHNIYAQDLEDAASASGLIQPGRAAAIGVRDESKGTEDIVLIVEPPRNADGPDPSIFSRIQQSVGRLAGVAVNRVLAVPNGWLVKSTSGKISRLASKQKALKEGLIQEC